MSDYFVAQQILLRDEQLLWAFADPTGSLPTMQKARAASHGLESSKHLQRWGHAEFDVFEGHYSQIVKMQS